MGRQAQGRQERESQARGRQARVAEWKVVVTTAGAATAAASKASAHTAAAKAAPAKAAATMKTAARMAAAGVTAAKMAVDARRERKPHAHHSGKVPTNFPSRRDCSGSSRHEYGDDFIATGSDWRHVGGGRRRGFCSPDSWRGWGRASPSSRVEAASSQTRHPCIRRRSAGRKAGPSRASRQVGARRASHQAGASVAAQEEARPSRALKVRTGNMYSFFYCVYHVLGCVTCLVAL